MEQAADEELANLAIKVVNVRESALKQLLKNTKTSPRFFNRVMRFPDK